MAYVRKYGDSGSFKSKPWDRIWLDPEKENRKDYLADSEKSDAIEPQPVESLSPEETWEMYKDFGPDEAYSIHQRSFSYCLDLDGKAGKINYNCVYVETPEGYEIAEKTLLEHYHNDLYRQYYSKVTRSSALVKKIMDNARAKDIYFLVKGIAKLTDAEFNSVKDKLVFNFLIDVAFNMVVGDGSYTPDTPEYKIIMALCAKIDSVLDTQSFVDIRKKKLEGYTISQFMEPMLFNNYTFDREADFDFTVMPKNRIETPVYTSHLGAVLLVIVYVLAVLLSGLCPAAALVGIPYLTIRKKLKKKKNPTGLKYKYR